MGQIAEYIKIALMSIKSNKARSFLTMLGIIIGIASVIMIISIGKGMSGEVDQEMNDMAGGQIYIMSQDTDKSGNQVYFDEDDMNYILNNVKHVKGVTQNWSFYGTISGPKGNKNANATAGTATQEFTSKQKFVKGHYFTDSDYYAANPVCVISKSGAMSLFGTTDVIGMSVDLTLDDITTALRIVGVREEANSSLMNMGYSDDTVTLDIPMSVLQDVYQYSTTNMTGFIIIADSNDNANEVAARSVALLAMRKGVRGENKITIENFNDILSQVNSVMGNITIFISFVAAISLIVGGIGVMNIMLVSVTERTREIGIRKALGARTSSIMTQFLAEASIITLMGGIIGILIGVGLAKVAGILTKIAPIFDPAVIIGAMLFSTAVGIFFGIYPAKKAAKLSPIEALRHE
ncbi:MAG: ABC transporter permease [Lachnospiraceae bacterium]|nr:ABC transporter permease [Lachnospiraceae bacterium]